MGIYPTGIAALPGFMIQSTLTHQIVNAMFRNCTPLTRCFTKPFVCHKRNSFQEKQFVYELYPKISDSLVQNI